MTKFTLKPTPARQAVEADPRPAGGAVSAGDGLAAGPSDGLEGARGRALALSGAAPSGPTRRGVMAVLASVAGALSFGRPAWAGPRAMGVRLGDHGDFTRIVLDVSEEVQFSLFTLADPYRVVIDLPEIEWEFREQGVFGGGGMIKALRYGLFQPGNSRVVFDLARPVEVRKAFVLPPGGGSGWRLVIDLGNSTHAEFVAASGPGNRIGQLDWRRQPAPQETAFRAPDPRAKQANRKPVIVLDPGHGGVDPGAIGVSGVYEKNITLAAGKEFKRALEATGKYTVHLTRDRDVFLRLRQRIAIARRHHADLFISLHADAIKSRKVRGLSVYTLSEKSSDAEAAALAEAENKADIIAGIDLTHESAEVTNILIDLAQRETMNLSSRLAETVIDELRRKVKLLRRSHRFAGFAVLKAPDVPSILVEMGYLSNPEEERLLRTRAYRAKLGEALVRAVDRYFTQVQKARLP